MKRMPALCVVIALLCVSSLALAQAQDRVFTLREPLPIQLTLPDTLYPITRDTPPDDPGFALIRFSYEQQMEFMKTNNLYLDALAPQDKLEIMVGVMPMLLGDFSQMDDGEIQSLSGFYTAFLSLRGATVLRSDVYTQGAYKYGRAFTSQLASGRTLYALHYITVLEGQAVLFSLQSYSDQALTAQEEQLLQSIVDSATLGSPKTQ